MTTASFQLCCEIYIHVLTLHHAYYLIYHSLVRWSLISVLNLHVTAVNWSLKAAIRINKEEVINIDFLKKYASKLTFG